MGAEDPNFFRSSRGIQPISVETIGYTAVSHLEFDNWCMQQMADGKFSGHAYDLFQNNCNNFSHHAALHGLLLERGVPQYILDIPQKFLSSPMGQMIKPMLESMQVQGGSVPFVPTGNGQVGSPPTTQKTRGDFNPWAQMKDHSSKPKIPLTPIINKYNQPLLSNDNKTAILCGKKFSESQAIVEAAKLLEKSQSIPHETLKDACADLLQKLDRDHHQTFGLMLLRLFILQDDDKICCHDCLQWVTSKLEQGKKLPDATLSMAWCCLSNAAATKGMYYLKHQNLLSIACQHISEDGSTLQVKQMASSFLYNLALELSLSSEKEKDAPSDGLEDEVVSLLCGALEGVDRELDSVTQKRRLLVVGHILKSRKTAADLVVDLGFDEILVLAMTSQTSEEKLLTKEVLALLQNRI